MTIAWVRRLSKTKIPHWLGPCASVLCLIHCFSLPVLIVLLPGVSHLLNEEIAHKLDYFFWITASGLGAMVLYQIRARPFVKLVFGLLAIFSFVVLLAHLESVFHVSLMGLAVIQLMATVYKHRSDRVQPPCCEHEHESSHVQEN